MPHSRRAFLASGAALGTVPLLGCGPQLRDLRLPDLPAALDEMRRLGAAPALQSQTAWGWAQTLEHLAQSLEYSMTGYPTQQSALFQRLAGRPAFQLFAWRGQMRHDLTAPIPGSPALAAGTPLAAAAALCVWRTHACRVRAGPRHAPGQPLCGLPDPGGVTVREADAHYRPDCSVTPPGWRHGPA
ncbi:DUF1569 domain-containing protein [Comamonas aquatica]|uniref:DUF1569 domain-containing protein n=1 Tax=Comamonas aquatica TaxID=225991 RepID=UPI0024496AAB|nr:DUF1569 domain-containing protein [Comamonas aquatica]MDH0383554.1 DUF1569 domain-containing protein [Comamonas aquatica]